MPRLDIERQQVFEPKRVQYAKDQIEKLGYEVEVFGGVRLEFEFKNYRVMFYPYSGWHAGRTIQDGRGIKKLLKQIK